MARLSHPNVLTVFDAGESGDELFVAVGPHRRNLLLPDSLRRREVRGAELVDGTLRVSFAEPARPAAAESLDEPAPA